MSDFPGPECGIFCISIIDLISKRALVLFNLLYARNYHYNKGSLKVEFIKCKTIHSGFLLVVVPPSISLKWVIKIVIISIIAKYTQIGTSAAIFHCELVVSISTSPFEKNHFQLPCHGNHWKTDQYRGSDNCGEVDIDSDVNRLALGNLR